MRNISDVIDAVRRRIELRIAECRDIRLPRPIVVIESDDWGSIRMPSVKVLDDLKAKGYRYADYIGYDKYDTLASNDDLEVLLDTLSSVKDSEGNQARLTMNTVVCNPNFERIRQSAYQEYYYELFTDTLKRYPNHDRSFSLWKSGIDSGVFHPQFHGREHLNVQMWLRLLRKGCKSVLDSFDKHVISMIVEESDDPRVHALAAYNVSSKEDYSFVKQSIIDGLDLFEHMFGYRSESMIAPNYTWDTVVEDVASSCGVKFLQGGRTHRYSHYVLSNGGRNVIRYTGQRNNSGQVYMVRNCSFEPSEYAWKNADLCLSQVKKAFDDGRPAIISSHRQNFIGGLYPYNRDNNIKEFQLLLKTIIAKYPDVIFLSSDELGKML